MFKGFLVVASLVVVTSATAFNSEIGKRRRCQDIMMTTLCQQFAKEGKCYSEYWVERNCIKTCGFCQEKRKLIPDVVLDDEPSIGKRECKDKIDTKTCVKFQSRCGDNDSVKNNCPMTCGSCTPIEKCFDRFPESCKLIAETGDTSKCVDEPYRTNCYKTCRTGPCA
ncbi:uncharacterized protein LOC110248520 [Exaiptasia diaphana]|uniref:ShKT domain-containing protein n=1 Tax=Exaiptasia diaphana TaxID=2652724 RepID=A0A913YTG9_EXADI|nr:uncharacterized protein LOC110248520 [Exaiptasia diaphana]